MPIYAYRCASCGHARDVLQKLSDPVLTVCPACGAESFSKQLTAAGFQLKGSGWYVTDFRNGSGGAGPGKSAPAAGAAGGGESAAGGGESAAPAKASEAPASGGSGGAASAAPSTSTGGCGGSCACH